MAVKPQQAQPVKTWDHSWDSEETQNRVKHLYFELAGRPEGQSVLNPLYENGTNAHYRLNARSNGVITRTAYIVASIGPGGVESIKVR